MGDYIRGKKAYTKWDAESENIDIEYRPDAQKKQAQDGWFSGPKGKVIKVLLVMMVFCMGLIMGFFLRRGIHEVVNHTVTIKTNEVDERAPYAYSAAVQEKLLCYVVAENIKQFLQNYTSEPHIAGKPASKKYVEHIKQLWQSWGLQNVHTEKFKVLLSYPSSTTPNKVHLINPKDNTTNDFYAYASESGDDESHSDLRPYLAYSPNKSAEGKLVYVNYGTREDFEYLQKLKINMTGCIAIMRLGKIHRANKIRFAEEFGIIGALLYPDPFDYVNGSQTYPDGVGLPGDGVIRGTLNLFPGDPETPFQASSDTAYRIPGWQIALPRIPVQPISYNNALRFMSNMTGPEVPKEWQGSLKMNYTLGPGHINSDLVVNISIFNELKEAEIYNLLAIIRGKFEPDRYVILGNHHDSWTNGTGDPGTGLAAFLEMVRAFGQLKQEGWLPGRTLVFALWDAEEFGMIGSTEWLGMHSKELASRAVAYINTDSAIEGNDRLVASGSPLLLQALNIAAKSVSFRQHGVASVLHHWLATELVIFDNTNPHLEILSSTSDYVSFMNMHGISSLHLQFVGKNSDPDYRLSHSAFDNFDAFVNYIDPHFEVSLTMAQLLSVVALHLSDSLKLPMNPEDYGVAIVFEFHEFNKTHGEDLRNLNVSLTELATAVEDFNDACIHFHNNFSSVNENEVLLGYHEYNDRMMELERALLTSHWELYRLYLRHAIFGPHPYNINQGIAFPQVVDSIFQYKRKMDKGLINRIRFELSQVVASLYSAVGVLQSSILNYVN